MAKQNNNGGSTAASVLLLAIAAATLFAWLRPKSAPAPVGVEPAWRVAHLSNQWRYIVIHHSATDVGGAVRFAAAHREKGWDELGYHFVIGNGTDTPDGAIEVGPRWREQKRGAHCKTPDGTYNQQGIGICLVGNFDNTRPTPAQLASLSKLLRFLCHECRIPPQNILTHGGITGKTECPGRNLNVEAIRARVR